MKSQNRLPKWPLYAADLLMLLAVLLIALPSALNQERMGAFQTLLCVLLCLGAMATVLTPYVLEFKRAKAMDLKRLAKHSAMIVQLAADIDAIHAGAEQNRENFDAVEQSLAKVSEKISEKGAQMKKASEGISNIGLEMEYCKGAIEKLNSRLDENEQRESEEEDENGELSEGVENLKERLLALEERLNSLEEAAAKRAEAKADNAEEEMRETLFEDEEDEEEEEDDFEEEDPQEDDDETDGDISEINMMDKAMGAGRSGFENSAIGRIISNSVQQDPQEESLEDGPEEEADPDEEEADEEFEEDLVSNGEEDERARKAAEFLKGADEDEEEEDDEGGELFDDIEESPAKAKAAKRGQTALVANALIGIGNKPYLRGNGGGLSPESGTPMEFVEIGKWQWICPEEISEPVDLKIYVNDETPLDSASCTIKPGERLEINLIYNA